MRCLTLADSLKEKGCISSFLHSTETLDTTDLTIQRGYEVSTAIEGTPVCDIMVVDHYGIDEGEEGRLASQAGALMVIDDAPGRPHRSANFLLDQTYARTEKDYSCLISENCQCLLGTDYALVRPEFHSLRQQAIEKRRHFRKIERLMIFTTSIDTFGATLKICESLEGLLQPLQIDLVLHPNSASYEDIKKYALSSRHQYTLHSHNPDMATLMLRADIAIGAGGTTSWERCVMGLPTIAVNLADNQTNIISALADADALIPAGKYTDSAFSENLEAAIADTLQWSPDKYIHKSLNAAAICDGLGRIRVTDTLTTSEK